jgi:hypothetical protein
MGAGLFHADERTDGETETKLIVAISNFVNTAKNHKLKGNIMVGKIYGYMRLVRNCFTLNKTSITSF